MALSTGNDKTVTIMAFVVLGHFMSLQNLGSEGKPTAQQCLAPEVNEGETGMMTFFIRQDVNFTSEKFFANLVRTHQPDWDILFCEQQDESPQVDCTVNSDHYQCKGVQWHRLTVYVPNISKNFEDIYIFRAYVNGEPEPLDFCSLKVKSKSVGTIKTETAETAWEAATAVGVALAIVIICIVIFFLRDRIFECMSERKKQNPSQEPLLQWGREAHLKMRWYFKDITKEEEKKLLQFRRNGNGSYLVRASFTNPENYVLVVCCDDALKHLTLVPRKGKIRCRSTNEVFRSVCAVVAWYKKEAIRVNDKEWGKLSKPFEKEPQEPWYFGELATEHEEKVMPSETSERGSFLVAVSSNDPDAYYLIVQSDGNICHFAVFPNDKGFDMLDTGETFDSLPKLVEHYTSNDIITVEKHTDGEKKTKQERSGEKDQHQNRNVDSSSKNYGKLAKPCSKDPFKGWYFQNVTREDLDIFSKSKRTRPGSFLITNDTSSQNTYLLRVYFDGEIRRFPVTRERNGLLFHTNGTFFYSWFELVDFYRAHELKIGDNGSVKLQKPFKKEPEEDWYFGPLKRSDEGKIFTGCSAGAFLIRDSITDPANYTLSMFYDGEIRQHVIISEDTGFKMINTNETFSSLSELVLNYKDNEIQLLDGTTCGKLAGTCTKDPPSEWCFEKFTTEDENKFMAERKAQPGCFLITDHTSSPNTKILAVYLDGEIHRFKVKQERNGLRFLTTDTFFYTWHELVDHYRNNDIKVNERVLGRLVKPFRKDFNKEWYFGSLSREDEGKLRKKWTRFLPNQRWNL